MTTSEQGKGQARPFRLQVWMRYGNRWGTVSTYTTLERAEAEMASDWYTNGHLRIVDRRTDQVLAVRGAE